MYLSSNQEYTKSHRYDSEYVTKRDPDNYKTGFIRKYMNGAVLIQSSGDSNSLSDTSVTNSVVPKRISCSCTTQNTCNLHAYDKPHKHKMNNKVKFKNTNESVVVDVERNNDHKEVPDEESKCITESSFEDWIAKKNTAKKQYEVTKYQIQEQVEQEKQRRLEQERENFKRWLRNKKQNEEKIKCEEEKKQDLVKTQVEEKERRSLECNLRYRLWLKKKEQKQLEKKIQIQLEAEKLEKEKQQRVENNEVAYAAWLKNSVNKPKPIPSGLGLDSLRSSQSVTYINPVPWSSDIETNAKQRI